MKISVVKLGRIDYQAALDIQQKLLKLSQQGGIGNVLLLLEHPPVLTVGINGKDANILMNEEWLKSKGVTVYHINRGGDVTYHGPGQIVGYPIVNLKNIDVNVKDYVKGLEETTIRLLKEEYNIEADRKSGAPGVWVGNNKITAIGCAVKRWVTMHGFAFNVNTNLEHFRWINPCGFTDKGVTSLQQLLEEAQDMEVVTNLVIKHFTAVFNMEPEIVEKDEFLSKLEEFTPTE